MLDQDQIVRISGCHDEGMVLTVFIFCVFPFIVFQNRSPFEDIAIIHLTKHIQHPFSYSQLHKHHHVSNSQHILCSPLISYESTIGHVNPHRMREILLIVDYLF